MFDPSISAVSMGSDDADEPMRWTCKREEVIYEQSTRIIETQIDIMNNIDDKAIDTVRIAAVIIGAFVTLAKVGGLGLFEPVTATVGVVILFSTLFAGIGTYNESRELRLGPDKEYLEQLTRNDFEGETWDRDYFESVGEWIETNHGEIEWNSKLLTATQIGLLLGLLSLSLSVAL